ncbi:hypothetical protein K9P40_07240 [Lentilactobacillus otakiensis]|nr:hypothetical protein [Lentilactobacillus otakiensis]
MSYEWGTKDEHESEERNEDSQNNYSGHLHYCFDGHDSIIHLAVDYCEDDNDLVWPPRIGDQL